MKLWLLSQDVNRDYDTYDSCVVAAETEADARLIHPATRLIHPANPPYKWDGETWRSSPDWTNNEWAPPPDIQVKEIGVAADGIIGVVCASYNAG